MDVERLVGTEKEYFYECCKSYMAESVSSGFCPYKCNSFAVNNIKWLIFTELILLNFNWTDLPTCMFIETLTADDQSKAVLSACN